MPADPITSDPELEVELALPVSAEQHLDAIAAWVAAGDGHRFVNLSYGVIGRGWSADLFVSPGDAHPLAIDRVIETGRPADLPTVLRRLVHLTRFVESTPVAHADADPSLEVPW